MIPWTELARARAPGGGELSLHRRDGDLVIRVDGKDLMTSREHASEERMAELACAHLVAAARARVLIGGLGMGFTVRAALDRLPATAEVVVAEISDAVVAWNRQHLGHLAGAPLDDARVEVRVDDVGAVLRKARTRYDAVLLDVDNGPQALSRPGNHGLYTRTGLTAIRRVLRTDGVLAVWSAARHPAFQNQLARAGFEVETQGCRARAGGRGARHTIYLGRLAVRGRVR